MFAPTPQHKTHRWLAGLAAVGFGALMALAGTTPATAAPDDGQWYLDALRVRQAQQISTGRGVTVAVIDSGIDSSRPALRGQLVSGKCFGSAEDIEPTWDPNGHGTAMAGLIAGNGKDGRHILGIAPGAKLMPLCISGSRTTQDNLLKDTAPAIRYAVDHGAQVVSISLGADERHASSGTIDSLHFAIAYAERQGVVLVAAAGNTDKDVDGVASPGRLPGVVAVAGSDARGQHWNGSATGKQVAIAAPAENLLTTNTRTVEDPQKGPHDTSGYTVSLSA